MNMCFIPLIWFQAAGIALIAGNIKQLAPIFAAACIISGALFTHYYFKDYPKFIAPYFYDGTGRGD